MSLGKAVSYEEEGIAMYSDFASKFENPVFGQILAIKGAGLNLLKNAKDVEFEAKKEGFDFSNIKDEKDAIFTALSYEIRGEKLYSELAANEENEGLKDLYFRIWATSVNEYKEALKGSLEGAKTDKESHEDESSESKQSQNYKYDKHLNPNDMGLNQLKSLKDSFDKFSSGTATVDDVNSILQNPSFSFVSGALVGALGGVFINQILKKGE
ncbi:MAG: hypothetical protein GX282_08260 [Campylobacteraceae bacterium]|nr:hypothetical protein [Campylobacteraceae bacterium]